MFCIYIVVISSVISTVYIERKKLTRIKGKERDGKEVDAKNASLEVAVKNERETFCH